MNDLISRQWCLDEYDKRHQGPPGGARKIIEEAPAVSIVTSEDTISRQAAIDAVETKIKKWNAVDGEGCHVGLGLRYTDVIDTLTELPSAQPKIIHCKECNYGVQDEDERWYCRGFGCRVGDEDGSGYCSDAERKSSD